MTRHRAAGQQPLGAAVRIAEGYHNLIKLVSSGFLEGFYYKPRIDYDLLAKHSKGLIALSACLRGVVTEAVVRRETTIRRARMPTGCAIFSAKTISSSRFRTRGWRSRRTLTATWCGSRKRSGIPLVATNDCHYLHHCRRACAGSIAVHSDRQDHERCAPHEICRPTSFISRPRRRWRRYFANCPMRSAAPWTSPRAAT